MRSLNVTMPDVRSDFDVAISFLNEDLVVATQLKDGLCESLDVFLYTTQQEELAGTDGLESFRDVFRRRSRLVVMLLRQGWGETRFTRIEREAIKDRLFEEGGGFMFVVMMERFTPPDWIPGRLIRFNLEDFGLAGAISAIKGRALEQGSVLHRPTPAALAEQSHRRAQFAARRTELFGSREGVAQASREAERLIALIHARAREALDAAPGLEIGLGTDQHTAVMTMPGVSVSCGYRNQIVNVLEQARLFIREFRGQLLLPGQEGFYRRHPTELAVEEYSPEVTPELGWCWRRAGTIRSSDDLAMAFVERFFRLLDRQSSGDLPPIRW